MREAEFRAREKKVQKMTRDGLVERNLAARNAPDRGSRVIRGENTGQRKQQRKRNRQRMEQEKTVEGKQPGAKHRAAGTIRAIAVAAAASGVSRKQHEADEGNVSEDAIQSVGLVAESAAGTAREQRRGKHGEQKAEPDRCEGRIEQTERQDSFAGRQKERKGAGTKSQQKQRLRKSYAQAAREAAKGAETKAKVLDSAGKVIQKAAGAVTANKSFVVVVLLLVLVFSVAGSLFSSCAGMFSGLESAVLSSCYLADAGAINRSELRYTEMEADLRKNIADTESIYPDYDEYRYEIGEIGHDPFELMGYLSAVFGSFTYEQVEPELIRLFGLQYSLRREVIRETRTYTDAYGEEQSYDWWVMVTALTVRPLSGLIADSLPDEGQRELYEIYMQTLGNRQCFGAPFEGWLDHVISGYGYRVKAETGEKELHRGIDIAAPEGTLISAVLNGTVVFAGDMGDFGLCVVAEDEKGYRSKYAHCASVSVVAGQEVQAGEVIAAVGNTGRSMESHLHLEVMYGTEYLNPVYFVGK